MTTFNAGDRVHHETRGFGWVWDVLRDDALVEFDEAPGYEKWVSNETLTAVTSASQEAGPKPDADLRHCKIAENTAYDVEVGTVYRVSCKHGEWDNYEPRRAQVRAEVFHGRRPAMNTTHVEPNRPATNVAGPAATEPEHGRRATTNANGGTGGPDRTITSPDRRAWWDEMVTIAQQAEAAARGTELRQVLEANLVGAVRCWCAVTGQDLIRARDLLRNTARAYPLHATKDGGRL